MARVFNGSSDMIVADAAGVYGAGVAAFSIAFWIKDAVTNNLTFYSEGNSGNLACISLGSNVAGGATLRWFVRSTSTTVTDVSSVATVLDGTWHHVAFTRDASRNTLGYIDGVSDVNLNRSDGTMTTGLPQLGMGVLRRTSNTNFYNGTLAEVANWSRVLAATEVAALAGGLPAYRLVPDHYWPLLGTASPEPDTGTAGAVNGTLTGTTSAVGPAQVDYATFIASLRRRPVPMIKGPDKDKVLSMRGNSF